MPKVSILVNCYNGEKYLKQALDSIYAQTFMDWEIIFIDNASTDSSYAIAKSYDSRLRYHRIEKTISLCHARVWAKQFLTGDYFAALDVDDLWLPTKLEKQIKVLEENPAVGLVYCNTIFFTDDGKERPYYTSQMPAGNIFPALLKNYFLSYETILIRKSVLDKNNLFFNPNFNIASDAELLIKTSYFCDSFYIDEPLAKWRYGHSSQSTQQFLSFPREYELLLDDLTTTIPKFHQRYSEEIKILRGKIAHMYGLGYWGLQDKKRTYHYLKEASLISYKYLLPLILSFIITYENYKRIRSLLKTNP